MEKQYFAYEELRKAVKKAMGRKGYLNNISLFLDNDGVIHNLGDLLPDKLAVTGLATLRPLFKDVKILTGRYADLIMEEGVPVWYELGLEPWSIEVNAEMGGVSPYLEPIQASTKRGRQSQVSENLPAGEVSEEARAIGCQPIDGYRWNIKYYVLPIEEIDRRIIWHAYLKKLEELIHEGKLTNFGIGPDEKAEDWAYRLYDPEIQNKTKGTITTSLVKAKWKDLARAVHSEVGEEITVAIREALFGSSRQWTVNCGLDCIEVLHPSIHKLTTSKRMLADVTSDMILTVGDSYKDIMMAQAAKEMGKHAIHIHVGNSEDLMNRLLMEDGEFPDAVVYFPDNDLRLECAPSYGSVATFEEFLFGFAKAIVEEDSTSLLEDLEKIKGAKVLCFEDVSEDE